MVAAQLSCIISWLVWASSWEDYVHGCWRTDWNAMLYLRQWLERDASAGGEFHLLHVRLSKQSRDRRCIFCFMSAGLINLNYFSVHGRGGTFKNQNEHFFFSVSSSYMNLFRCHLKRRYQEAEWHSKFTTRNYEDIWVTSLTDIFWLLILDQSLPHFMAIQSIKEIRHML